VRRLVLRCCEAKRNQRVERDQREKGKKEEDLRSRQLLQMIGKDSREGLTSLFFGEEILPKQGERDARLSDLLLSSSNLPARNSLLSSFIRSSVRSLHVQSRVADIDLNLTRASSSSRRERRRARPWSAKERKRRSRMGLERESYGERR